MATTKKNNNKKSNTTTNKNTNKKENKVMTTKKENNIKKVKKSGLPPITEKQMELLVKLGVDESEFKDLDIREASRMLHELKESGAFENLPPKQVNTKKENKKESGSSKKKASSTAKASTTPNVHMQMENKSVKKLTDYLENFAKEDKNFAKKFKKDKMEECLNYIGSEIYKQAQETKSNAVMVDDDDIYKLARHFFLDVYKEKDENEGFKVKFSKEAPKQEKGFTTLQLKFDF